MIRRGLLKQRWIKFLRLKWTCQISLDLYEPIRNISYAGRECNWPYYYIWSISYGSCLLNFHYSNHSLFHSISLRVSLVAQMLRICCEALFYLCRPWEYKNRLYMKCMNYCQLQKSVKMITFTFFFWVNIWYNDTEKRQFGFK